MAQMPNRKALLGSLGQEDDGGLQPLGLMGDPSIKGDYAPPAAPLAAMTNNPGVGEGWSYGGAAPAGSIATGEPAPNSAPPRPDAPMGLPEGPKPAGDLSRTMGLDSGKFNDPNKHDFKYDTQRLLSRFDPRQGYTPEVIAALNNELGSTYGQFSGSGDKWSLTGAKGAKDAADFTNQDGIFAHKANSDATKWNFGGGGVADAAAAGGAAGGGMSGIPSELAGDPMAQIQAALAKYAGKSPNIQALLAQLGGA